MSVTFAGCFPAAALAATSPAAVAVAEPLPASRFPGGSGGGAIAVGELAPFPAGSGGGGGAPLVLGGGGGGGALPGCSNAAFEPCPEAPMLLPLCCWRKELASALRRAATSLSRSSFSRCRCFSSSSRRLRALQAQRNRVCVSSCSSQKTTLAVTHAGAHTL